MFKDVPERSSCYRQVLKTVSASSPPEREGETNAAAEWIRLPRAGERCAFTGLTRGTLNDLIFANPPKIRSVVLKKPEASRGIRLIYWPSLHSYLLDLMDEQEEKSNREEECNL